jgi:hypothetical protein
MSSLAELEADLFLAERACKRVPSDQNKEALAKVKKAIESLEETKENIQAAPVAVKKPVAPKATAAPKAVTPKVTVANPVAPKAVTPKATAAKITAPDAGTTETTGTTDDSKKK